MGANDPIPCAVSIAELAHDRSMPEWSVEELARAREEVIEEILEGKKVEGTDLESVLDAAIESNPANMVRSLYEHFANIGNLGDLYANLERCRNAAQWMQVLVESYVDAHDDLISDRAADNHNERQRDYEGGLDK